MKLHLILSRIAGCVLLASCLFPLHAADLAEQLQKGLYEEEANHDLKAAMQHYQAVIQQTDQQRRIAATALYHLAECYRKLGKTNDAQNLYERLLRDYSDQAANFGGALLAQAELSKNGSGNGGRSLNSRTNQYAGLMRLLENSPDLINATGQTNKGYSFLQEAASTGNVDLIKLLLGHGARVNEPQDMPPLYLAAEQGHKTAVEVLIKAGANVNARNKSTATPLHIAALRGYTGVSEVLIEDGAALDLKARIFADLEEATPLQYSLGHPEETRLLLRRGANINATNSYGSTALLAALKNKQPAAAQLLISSNANVNMPNRERITPLQLAAMNGYSEICKELLERGADPNVADNLGQTPLMRAADAGSFTICKLLLESGADPNLRDQQGQTVLNQLVNYFKTRPTSREQEIPLINLMLEHGADPNIRDNSKMAPLDHAVDLTRNYFSNVPTGLNQGAFGHNGAPVEPVVKIVKLLLAHGAKTDSALWYTLDTPTILKLLLEAKANPNVLDPRGKTPLDYMTGSNPLPRLPETRELIIRYGGTNTISSGNNSSTQNNGGAPILSEGGQYQLLPNRPLLQPNAPSFQQRMNEIVKTNTGSPEFKRRLNAIVGTIPPNTASNSFEKRLDQIITNSNSTATNSVK